MNEMRILQGQAGIVGLCRNLYVVSLLVLNICFARIMGPETFGSFQQVFIFNALFLILTFGIPETLYYFLPRLNAGDRPRFLGQTLVFLISAGVICTTLFWFAAPYFAKYQHNPELVSDFRMFGVYGAFIIASAFADPIFITFGRIRYLFFLNAIHAVFLLGLTGWYYIYGGAFATVFLSMAVFGAVKFLIAVVFLFRMRGLTGEIWFFKGKGTLALQLSFALPIMLSTTTDIIARWLDKYVVSFFFGSEALGVFFVGAIEIPFIGVFIASVYSVVSPVLNSLHHKNDFKGFARLVNKTMKFTVKFVWPVFLYFFIFADHIIPLVFKDDYTGAITPFRIYLLMLPLRVASYGVIVVALGRPRVVLQCALLALAANLVMNIILALQIGYIGPAVATVASTFLHVAMLLTVITTDLGVRLGDLVPFRHIGIISLMGAVSAALAYGVTFATSADMEVVIISFIVFTAVYLFLGARTGLVRISDLLDSLGLNGFGEKS